MDSVPAENEEALVRRWISGIIGTSIRFVEPSGKAVGVRRPVAMDGR